MFKFICLLFVIPIFSSASGSENKSLNGDWELKITGQDKLEFGTQFLSSGVIVNWQVNLLFSIENEQFKTGTAFAELDKEIQQFSLPEKTFTCQKEEGSYVSKSGQIFQTPHLRYKRFPITAVVKPLINGIQNIFIQHGMDYPGNYYGLLFECKTEHDFGKNWLQQGPRNSKERGSRQSIHTSFDGQSYKVKIKQVKEIAPGSKLEIPLINHWSMIQNSTFDDTKLKFELLKVK